MARGKRLCLVVLALAMMPAGARAATLTVNTTQDNIFGSDGGNCTLREAMRAVNTPGTSTDCGTADASGNTIVLGPETYKLTNGVLIIGPPPTGCFSGAQHADDNAVGDLVVMGTVHDLTIKGAGSKSTVIDACKLGDRAFTIESGATGITIRNLTITNGNAPHGLSAQDGQTNGQRGGDGHPGENGGAINNAGALTLDAVTISDSNAGPGSGGGNGHHSTDTTAGGGGGTGGAGGAGGGIYNASSGSLTLTDSTISGNAAGHGGPGGTAADSDSGSSGDGGSGGAGGNGGGVENFGQLTVTGSTIANNQGGAGNDGQVGPPVSHSSDQSGGAGGSGGNGGAGGGIASLHGSVSILNTTITGNLTGPGGFSAKGGEGGSLGTAGAGGNGGAGGAGGGLAEAATATSLLSVTVADNSVITGQPGAPSSFGGTAGADGSDGIGGGVFVPLNSTLTLQASVLDRNKLGGTPSYENCGTTGSTPIATVITDHGHNIAYAPPSLQTLHHPGACPSTFTFKDPKLGLLQDNLGPTATMALTAGSAAIDQVPSDGGSCPPTDQRGFKRPSGPACDIGAYEVTPPAVSTAPANKISKNAATIRGKVTAFAKTASVHFEFGKTTNYGSSTPSHTASGTKASTISAHLTNLKPNTTYHFRVVASSQDGTSKSADAKFKTKAKPPAITKLHIKLKAGKAKLTYRDSRKAKTTFVIHRCSKAGKCTKVKSFTHKDAKGHNTVRFTPPHKKGHYQVVATPKANGVKGKSRKVSFKVT